VLPFLHSRNGPASPLHIIAARASTESPGPWVTGSLATLIQNSNPGTDLESVNYPATINNYASSSAQGTAALTAQITAYVNSCPSSKVVLLGYSQVRQDFSDCFSISKLNL